jgi:ABC-type branched-subunit amino acid transport system permease subunit
MDATREAGRGEDDQKKAVTARARTRTRVNNDFRDPLSVGPRPQALWHPWPLSEMLILVGIAGTAFGLARLGHGGIHNGGPVLFAGLGAVVLGTIEMTWREHHAGYRSHTLILALLPVVVMHSAIVLGLAAFTTVPRLLNVGLLALDAAVFAVLFKLLRARHLDARARVVSRR